MIGGFRFSMETRYPFAHLMAVFEDEYEYRWRLGVFFCKGWRSVLLVDVPALDKSAYRVTQ